jgi:hypothetical protein
MLLLIKRKYNTMKKMFTGFFVLTLGILTANMSYDYTNKLLQPKYGSMIQVIDQAPDFKVPTQDQTMLPNAYLPVVRLEEAKSKTNPNGFICTGTVINNDYVLTAAHCLVDSNGVMHKTIKIKGMKSTTDLDSIQDATPAAVNTRSDVGLVRGDFKLFQKMKVYTNANLPNLLNRTGSVNCGFAWGDKNLACYPLVFVGTEGFQLAAQGAMYPGMSGGPVIDIQSGYVIAVNTAVGGSIMILSPLIAMFDYFGINVIE